MMIRRPMLLLTVLCTSAMASMAVAAEPNDGLEDTFQVDALFAPSAAQLRAEANGRVMIYDGLQEDVVERALDEEFDRVEHMMFINIRREQRDGVMTSDDDC